MARLSRTVPDVTALAGLSVELRATIAVLKEIPMVGGQELVDPYIVTRNEESEAVQILIANREGQAWYDRVEVTECTYCRVLGMAQEGDVVFDVGANQGVLTLGFSSLVGTSGKVYAFDPFPINSYLIDLNAKLNGRSNIVVQQCGLGAARSQRRVSMSAQSLVPVNAGDLDVISVEVRTLDEFCEWGPDLLKIDVEGAEIDCLLGAAALLATGPSIAVEMHPDMIRSFGRVPEEIFEILPFAGYDVWQRFEGECDLRRVAGPCDLDRRCWLYFVSHARSGGVRRAGFV